ncbi:MAG: hypothetical protein MRZ79_17105 [Bacteroidia bacterium]|nr:hypothetical protein [Bacteroidia bacterium]
MFIVKNFNFRRVWRFSGRYIIGFTLYATLVTLIYHYSHSKWLQIPWLPLSLIGTAVAFYVGFKNNSSYGRMWEARKIWGAIVNSSRAWGMYVKSFINNKDAQNPVSAESLKEIKTRLIHRHIAWLYALRSQLLVVTPWEHASQRGNIGMSAQVARERLGIGMIEDGVTSYEMKLYLPESEHDELMGYRNTATQIIDKQSEDLAELTEQGLVEDIRLVELQNILYHFYEHQGKCERIKNFPFPRQYGSMGLIFVGIFIFLLPFGMVSEFAKLGDWGVWLAIPFTVLVSWVYLVMELVGDYSENPFQGMSNDIPMLSLCRTIEIDLLEMIGKKELPPKIESKDGILM